MCLHIELKYVRTDDVINTDENLSIIENLTYTTKRHIYICEICKKEFVAIPYER